MVTVIELAGSLVRMMKGLTWSSTAGHSVSLMSHVSCLMVASSPFCFSLFALWAALSFLISFATTLLACPLLSSPRVSSLFLWLSCLSSWLFSLLSPLFSPLSSSLLLSALRHVFPCPSFILFTCRGWHLARILYSPLVALCVMDEIPCIPDRMHEKNYTFRALPPPHTQFAFAFHARIQLEKRTPTPK